jgi:predicted ATPase
MADMSKTTLKEIYVSGYKNLFNCRLTLDQLTVIVGSNNSGKSNFLELFSLLSDLHFGGQDEKSKLRQNLSFGKPIEIKFSGLIENHGENLFDVSYRIVISPKQKPDVLGFSISSESFGFKQKSAPGKHKIVFHREENVLSWRTGPETFRTFEISPDSPAYLVIKASIDPEKLQKDALARLNLFTEFLEYFKTVVFSSHKLNSNYNDEIQAALKAIAPLSSTASADFENFKSAFTEILGLQKIEIVDVSKHMTELGASDPSIQTIFCVVFEETRGMPMLLTNMSDGSKILFIMLYNIFIKKSSLICIEEPEIGLHPSALNKVLKILLNNAASSQFILTTHSSYLLNIIDPRNIFLMEGLGDGTSTLTQTSTIAGLEQRLKGKYVNFGDIFAENFKQPKSYKLTD